MKRFLTTILWFCAAYVGFAQTAIGVKVNTPLHTFNFFNDLTSNESYEIEIYPRIAAFNSGVFAHFQLAKRWALQTVKCFIAEKHCHFVLKIAVGIPKNALIMSLIT